MAKITKKESDLQNSYERNIKSSSNALQFSLYGILGVVITLILVVFHAKVCGSISLKFILGTGIIIFICICFILAGVFGASVFSSRSHIYEIGLSGEEDTADLIENLPDGFYGVQNVVINYNGDQSELDMVVVGPTGIFIIETKNLNGFIKGNFADRQWTQHKVGRGGTPYSREFYSPVKQVGTHVFRLARVLRNKNIRYTVNPIVYFVNPDTTVEISGQNETPVFVSSQGGDRDIIRYIMSLPQTIPPKDCQKIVRFLEEI